MTAARSVIGQSVYKYDKHNINCQFTEFAGFIKYLILNASAEGASAFFFR